MLTQWLAVTMLLVHIYEYVLDIITTQYLPTLTPVTLFPKVVPRST